MKIYNTILCGAMLLGAATLAGCSDEETYDVRGEKGNLVYVDQASSTVTECKLYRTPVGLFGDASANISVKLQYPISSGSIDVTAKVDTSLVSEFNKQNNTKCLSMPEGVLNAIQVTPVAIKKDTIAANEALKVEIPDDVRPLLTGTDYVLPLRLGVTANGVGGNRPILASQSMGNAYLVVHITDDIAAFSGNTVAKSAIVRTPVGVFGGISGTFAVSMNKEISSDVMVSADVDNSLVSKYNDANGTSYAALPSNVASSLTVASGKIAAGEKSGTIKVSVADDAAKSLDGAGYVIPLRLTMTYSDGTKVTVDNSVAYIVVTTKESLINSAPTELLGSPADASGWTCIEATNFDKGSFAANSWKPSVKNISEGSYVIDLGAVHKISGFREAPAATWSDVVKSSHVYISEDNVKWTDLGSSEDNKTVNASGANWYVLYGGVPARYVKFVVSFNPDSYYWQYYDYSWATRYVSVSTGLAYDD